MSAEMRETQITGNTEDDSSALERGWVLRASRSNGDARTPTESSVRYHLATLLRLVLLAHGQRHTAAVR